MILGTNTEIKVNLFLDGNKIEKCQEVVLLGITIDDKLSFKRHIKNICRRGKYKLHALQRIRKYLSTDDAKTLCNAFINTQFYYAPLIWMSAGKLLISRVQKKSIFRRYKWFITHMTQLMMNFLSINSDVSIHQRHLSLLLKSLNQYTTSIHILCRIILRQIFLHMI